MPGPRIYNLFPLLAGSVPQWTHHLPRIAEMKFNGVFVNPFHEVGASGSLYAVKDYYQLNPFFRNGTPEPSDDLMRHFLDAASGHNLRVLMDLVINHTAKDSPLVTSHPEWYRRNPDGSVRSPGAVDPNDPNGITVWEDLAEIDFETTPQRKELLNYWKDVVRHYIKLGFGGFRCDAAYKVPGWAWNEIIGAGKELNPNIQFFAETLGAKPEEITQLGSARFDYFFNSSKWWDFRGEWLLKDYEHFRHLAPSISFPESHDTDRLATEKNGDERQSRLWYLFAAFFSSGVMMPVGYEFGFRKKLHVVKTTPQDWEAPSFDMAPFIKAANEMKEQTAVLNEEGPQERTSDPLDSLVVLVRRSDRSEERVAALINTHSDQSRSFAPAELQRILNSAPEHIHEITPATQETWNPGQDFSISPLAMRIFHYQPPPSAL